MASESVTNRTAGGKPERRPETPDTVHGRLLEAVHISGYTMERACSELEWLLDEDRWRQAGGGFTSINDFLGTLDLSEFRIAVEQRQKIARRLREVEASQRATANMLGVDESTIRADLGKKKSAGNPASAVQKPAETLASSVGNAGNPAPGPAPWFQGESPAVLAKQKQETAEKRAAKEDAREARRDENRQKVAEVPEPAAIVGQARFATITIDPPWDWGDEGDVDQMGRARPTYKTMRLEELLRLPVGELADDDCHLYLWITNRSLPKGFQLIERWGFRYITAITWVKPHFGMGNYFRGQTEHVLFGVKGSQPLKRKDIGTVLKAPRGPLGHSSKPVEFYDLVESASPGPYLEMFSRCERPDWTMWGEGAHVVAA